MKLYNFVIPRVAREIPVRQINWLLFLIFFILLCTQSHAMSITDETRYTELTKEIRCVVCQNQSIADSHAPLANDLRKKVYLMVNENKSDDDIKNYLVARYGEFILLKPRFNRVTSILWVFPFASLLIVLGVLTLRLTLRRKKRRSTCPD
jgi:cytochrome c-type biogenesis protein CcmH